jgi:hypothetical protein
MALGRDIRHIRVGTRPPGGGEGDPGAIPGPPAGGKEVKVACNEATGSHARTGRGPEIGVALLEATGAVQANADRGR